jgi:hypothetical protein
MHMARRIHVVLDDRERASFKARAVAEGMSLSEWLRIAGRERLERGRPTRITTVDDLSRFFDACDVREQGREPDWVEHLRVAARSRGQATEPT